MFDYDESIQEYSAEIRGIKFISEEVNEYTEDMAMELAKAYYDKYDSIIEFIVGHMLDTYPDIKAEGIEENIGKSLIDMDTKQLVIPYRSSLFIHYLTVEFTGLFDKLSYFSMDG